MKPFFVIFFALRLSAQQPGLDAPTPFAAFSNGILPLSAPGSATGWASEDAFPNLQFVDPIWLTQIPGTSDLNNSDQGELLLVGKDGQIFRFANDPTVQQNQVVTILDWRTRTQTDEDTGFYQFIFHPNFGQSGEIGETDLFACYSHRPNLSGADPDNTYWRVSRFQWLPASGTIDANSEQVLINQYDPQRWHNGGAMYFDNEGFLNITCGDGEFEYWHQNANGPISGGFFGGLLRIDVDYEAKIALDPSYAKSHAIRRQPIDIPAPDDLSLPPDWTASSTQGYGIPNTNPWQDPAGSLLEEFVIHGLRSPHTAWYDPIEDEVWVGDVGGGLRDEIGVMKRGDNGQWPIREGLTGGAEPANSIGRWTPPVHDYSRNVGTCIIGGMRYRGAKWNALLGNDTVLFGDHSRGKIWMARYDGAGAFSSLNLSIEGFKTGSKAGLCNFCIDDAGEVYLMELNGTNNQGGRIKKLATQGVSTEPPQFLSQTGLFTDVANLVPAPALIPYDVANPLWSDGADKYRWIAIPNDGTHNSPSEKIIFDENYHWQFPAGSVLVKHFEIQTDSNNPATIKRLETRLIVCTEGNGIYGVTYKWNEAGTDAELLTTGLTEPISFIDAQGDPYTRNWDYPSRADCLQCHNPAAGQALGVRAASLNFDHHYPSTGRSANQLHTLNSLGIFDQTLSQNQMESLVEARAIDDLTAPLEHRFRSYLDSNCAHCHQPGAIVDYFDARLGTPLKKQNIIEAAIQGHYASEFPGASNGRYIKPGDVANSAAHFRTSNVGNGDAMPPLAKNLVDDAAVALMEDYILSLNAAEFTASTKAKARFIRLTALSDVNGNPWTSVAEFTPLDSSGLPIPASQLTVADFDSEELIYTPTPATNAIDGDPYSFWHTEWVANSPNPPHHITIDLGSLRLIGGYTYTPRQDLANGRIADYQVHYSEDGGNWILMDSGTWGNNGNTIVYDELTASRKARCEIAGPVESTVAGNFDVTIVFDMNVDDFQASDLAVTGGSIAKLRGSGYYYVASIKPEQSNITVQVPADVANINLEGNLSSQTLTYGFVDTLGPIATFSPSSGTVDGPFNLAITFSEIPVGLTLSHLSAANATLSNLTGSETNYSVIVTPISQGNLAVTLSPAGISDELGNSMTDSLTSYFTYSYEVLAHEAEDGILAGGMTIVNDPNSSNSQFIWIPDGAYPNNSQSFNSANSATYSFVLPRSGNWTLEALLQSNDYSSDSFWFQIDEGAVQIWDTNPVGTGNFQWDNLRSRSATGDPLYFNLSSGPHTVTLIGRDDGTRLDAVRMVSERPLATLSGTPLVIGQQNFTATLTFSDDVTGLEESDLIITGATITGLAGSGSTYQISLSPTASNVTINLPENTTSDAANNGNHRSNTLFVENRTLFSHWAITNGIGPAHTNDDPNGDGLPLLLEYMLNLDPTTTGATIYDPAKGPSGLPAITLTQPANGTERLQITFPANLAAQAAGYRYIGQFSDDLINWEDIESGTNSPINSTWEERRILDPESITTRSHRYARLKVIAP